MTTTAGFTTTPSSTRRALIARLRPADWAEDGITGQDASRLHALFNDWHDRLANPKNP